MSMEDVDPWEKYVDTRMNWLNSELNVGDQLLNSLMGKKLASGNMLLVREDKENIKCASASLTPARKVEHLIGILRKKGPKHETFRLFCAAMQELRRGWIVEGLFRGSRSEPIATPYFTQLSVASQKQPDPHQEYKSDSGRMFSSEIMGARRQHQELPYCYRQITGIGHQQMFAFGHTPRLRKNSVNTGTGHYDGFGSDSYGKGVTSDGSRVKTTSTGGSETLLPELSEFSMLYLSENEEDREKEMLRHKSKQLELRCQDLEQQLAEKASENEELKKQNSYLLRIGPKVEEERKKLENENSFKNKRITELEKTDCDWRHFCQNLQSLAEQHKSTIKGLTTTIGKQNSEIKELHQKISEIGGSSTGMGLSFDPSDSDATSAKEAKN